MDLSFIDKEIQNKIYDDLFSPSLKNAWQALGNLVWLVETITLPFYIANIYTKTRTNNILRKNLERYEEKIKDIPDTDRIPVQPEIWVPILNKLTYYNNERLSDLFLELLSKSANKNKISEVHPKYIGIIENLSEDEAIILEYIKNNYTLKENQAIPYININLDNGGAIGTFERKISYFSELKDISNLSFPENIYNYIENLISLWILDKSEWSYLSDEKEYNELIADPIVTKLKEEHETSWSKATIQFEKKFFQITYLW